MTIMSNDRENSHAGTTLDQASSETIRHLAHMVSITHVHSVQLGRMKVVRMAVDTDYDVYLLARLYSQIKFVETVLWHSCE